MTGQNLGNRNLGNRNSVACAGGCCFWSGLAGCYCFLWQKGTQGDQRAGGCGSFEGLPEVVHWGVVVSMISLRMARWCGQIQQPVHRYSSKTPNPTETAKLSNQQP